MFETFIISFAEWAYLPSSFFRIEQVGNFTSESMLFAPDALVQSKLQQNKENCI